MTTVKELREWLDACERNMNESLTDAPIYIEDGGLALRIGHDDAELYLEIGGEPEDE